MRRTLFALASLLSPALLPAAPPSVVLTGTVTDAQTGKPLPCRVYVQSAAGQWHFVRSADENGRAVTYERRRREKPESVEINTSISAHPFRAELPPGEYTLRVERGKEYFPEVRKVRLADKPVSVDLKLRRWIDMAQRHWYSGDTHIHHTLDDVPTLQLAEDLNVTLPLTSWVTVTGKTPSQGRRSIEVASRVIELDPKHVIWPRNTEYEIFSVGSKRHPLGAVFVLNQKDTLELAVPPVKPVAVEAHRQRALLDLDKHTWPWSMMIVPIMNVDLFELSNNHVWQTEFAFHQWTIETDPHWPEVETTEAGWTERGWIEFGHRTYWALLNCNFRMRPTAGTAAGVHPVFPGFGRVYVQLPEGFSYDAWMKGLDAGRSFVTTGPMLFARFNDRPPGTTFKAADHKTCRVTGTIESAGKPTVIEIVANGEISKTIKPQASLTRNGSYVVSFETEVPVEGTTWVAVRCWSQPKGGRERFAHTAPVWFDDPQHPVRPRRREVRYLIKRMEEELARNKGVLDEKALDEYREALKVYQGLAKRAR